MTPDGAAGQDTRYSIEESADSHLERMFMQHAKWQALKYSVGRTSNLGASRGDTLRFQSQRAECNAAVNFHAGRALDLAMQLVFAVVADRIFGRRSAAVDGTKTEKERRRHHLYWLYNRILEEAADRSDPFGADLRQAFDDAYQRALHKGVVDALCDDNIIGSYVPPEDQPFRTISDKSLQDGVELTVDPKKTNLLAEVFGQNTPTPFDKMPLRNFDDFLRKADKSYLGEGPGLNMRGNDYHARDQERFKSYARAGTEFFGRLCREIVTLADQPGVWHDELARRFFEQRTYIVGRKIKTLIAQNFQDTAPALKTIDDLKPLTFEAWREQNLPLTGRSCKPPHRKLYL
ncbi:MAG: hypothetical protein OXC91_04775 [Rhodobacteraceae bacterium]|nr:hypothetical protein [Paracoccaceae bacterium]